ncbi:MAG: bifunctional demethylmenaquinone methyltransferase/2-methoxy-6-polyprenyl-1,4-benzoquinol methylase UbiE [Thiovulaceae bacterium]|nr:bifunctional demethylmenaquinone methyltransferase/2-methoxy-6-polyprenyl-1,4-benzoquinol methylase UbiE [Sulfurimonadaceae bacterium]
MSNKQENIVSMFNQIAKTYDKANRVLSFGIDIIWRKKACNKSFDFYGKSEIDKIIDVACGTGDMMAYWKKQANRNGIEVKKLLGVDPSEGMVAVAQEKFPDFNFDISYATQINEPNDSADIVSITYGIRNVMERQEAFQEFNRVLKKGGLVVILEFTKSEKKTLLSRFTGFYLNKILPKIGGLISKNKEAYEYLPNSIEGFLTTQMLENELIDAGFEPLMTKSFSMNISTMFIAKKVR